jgi:hypothetical protein
VTIEKTRDQVARIARNTGKLIELGRDLSDDEIVLLEAHLGGQPALNAYAGILDANASLG